jgi:2-polyprenyl-3-methyl-5-hydroxy-6-metoxy-1,4-benzoquinol methylase
MQQLQLNEGSRILDVACGNGTFGEWFQKRIDVEMYGLDLSPVAVDLCKKVGYRQVELADLDRDPMPYLNDFFDLAILSAILEHVMSPDRVLREVWKRLKPGGKVVILTPNVAWILKRLLFMLGRWDHPRMGGTRGHISYMNKAQLATILQQAGYENIDWTHSVVYVAGGGKTSTKGLTGLIARILDGRCVYKWQSLWAFNFIVTASKPKQTN